MSEWTWTTLGAITDNFDSLRRPVKSSDRIAGKTPYYGASGVIDWVEGHTHDGEYLLVAEDGENLRSRATPIAFMTSGRAWVNNHAHVITGNANADTRFLKYILNRTDLTGYLTGSAQPKLSRASMDSIRLKVPDLRLQRGIAEVLGALDDKIAANTRLVLVGAELAGSLLRKDLGEGSQSLGAIAEITMGSSPPGTSYNETGQGMVFHQGVRDFGVRSPSNRVWTTAPVRVAEAGDTLVSVRAPVGKTNVATEAICIGRGLAGLRSRRPATLYHLLRSVPEVWAPYEAEGTVFGSINKTHLDNLPIPVVEPSQADALEARLATLDSRLASALDESERLVATRDALLPFLMSGRVTVKDAESVVGEVL